MADVERDHLARDEWVSRYGSGRPPKFHQRPHPDADPPSMSVIRGRVAPEEAARQVRNDLYVPQPGKEAVRYALVGDLIAAGFAVYHDPLPGMPDHSSVEISGVWTDDVGDRFDRCFGSPVIFEQEESGA